MIKSFEIENFRLFDHLKINRLSRVNLVAGKNNTGKSAFLEAALLHYARMSEHILFELLEIRQEDSGAFLAAAFDDNLHPFRHIFKKHSLPEPGQPGIKLSAGSSDYVSVKVGTYIRNMEGHPGELKEVPTNDSGDHFDEMIIRYLIVSERNTEKLDAGRKISLSYQPRRSGKNGFAYGIVPPCGPSDSSVAAMWDKTSLGNESDKVIEALRLLEPESLRLSFIERDGSRARVPFVKLDCFDEPVPLKSLGDGMTRILHIILSLVSCKGGVLLIDEFENGLHWSVQPKVWKMIFELAKKLDVQVFATTHSRDCVAGFHEVWEENESDGAFLRLMREENRKPVEEYSLEQLRKSIEIDVEVR
ncbi:MAG: AAA family ATPase [Verrucomicrobia bacterium]|nr:AAA family ATPase [Verrucomicrobiota bacterium]